MNKLFVFIFMCGCFFTYPSFLHANGGGCARCDEIREQNKKLVNDFTYYEEFVQKHPDQAKPVDSQNDMQDSKIK